LRIAALIFGIAAGAVGLWMGLFAPAAAGLDLANMGTLPRLGLLIALFVVPMVSIAGAILSLTNLRRGGIVMLIGAIGWLLVGVATGNHVTPTIGGAILLSVVGAVVAFIADSGVMAGQMPDPAQSVRPRRAASAVAPTRRRAEPIEPVETEDDFEPEPPPRQRAAAPQPTLAAPMARSRGRREPVVDFVEDHSIEFRLDPTDPYDRPIGASPASALRRAAYQEEPGRNFIAGLARFLQLAFAVLFVGGLAALLVIDYARGPNSLLFAGFRAGGDTTASAPATPAPSGQQAAPATAVANAPQGVTAPLPNLPQMAPAEPVVPRLPPAPPGLPLLGLEPTAPSTAAPAPRQIAIGGPQTQPTAPASTPATRSGDIPYPMPLPERLRPRSAPTVLAPAPTVASGNNDPFAYCAQIGTNHRPDPNAVQNGLPMALVQNLRQIRGAMSAPARWRCLDGKVQVCIDTGNAVCDVTPDAQAMLAFCRVNPGMQNIAAPAGSWSCDGQRPVIPPGQVWPVDANGFLPRAWVAAAPP
jgi:hypothetical protein